jgi:MFS family permease
MGLALGAWQVVYIVSAPVGGRLIDRLGLHRGILLEALLLVAMVCALMLVPVRRMRRFTDRDLHR